MTSAAQAPRAIDGQPIGGDERLPAQCLPEEDAKSEAYAAAATTMTRWRARVRDPSAQRQGDERQDLDRVQADEMRNTKVAVFGAPPGARQPSPAVRAADRVGTGDPHSLAGASGSRAAPPLASS